VAQLSEDCRHLITLKYAVMSSLTEYLQGKTGNASVRAITNNAAPIIGTKIKDIGGRCLWFWRRCCDLHHVSKTSHIWLAI